MFLHITEARPLKDFCAEVAFNDGRRGVADLSSALHGGIFEPLRDPAEFARMRVDPELKTIVWPNGADLAPEFVYFQAFKADPSLESRFRAWGYLT